MSITISSFFKLLFPQTSLKGLKRRGWSIKIVYIFLKKPDCISDTRLMTDLSLVVRPVVISIYIYIHIYHRCRLHHHHSYNIPYRYLYVYLYNVLCDSDQISHLSHVTLPACEESSLLFSIYFFAYYFCQVFKMIVSHW